jgi:cytochrome b subunit of formate dehydrogenase
MSSKGKINYWIDVAIAVAFLLSALSGLVLFFAPSGYQGGRNPYYGQTVLLLSTQAWNTVHTWASVAMISGVGAHLVLHWDWLVCMSKRVIEGLFRRPIHLVRQTECPPDAA